MISPDDVAFVSRANVIPGIVVVTSYVSFGDSELSTSCSTAATVATYSHVRIIKYILYDHTISFSSNADTHF